MSIKAAVRPLLLIPNTNVKIEVNKQPLGELTNIPGPASVETADMKSFTIRLYESAARGLWDQVWLKGKITFEEFCVGFILHEVAHIKYGTFNKMGVGFPNKLFSHIDNILEDARIEYLLTMDHPAYSKYLRWILSSIRRQPKMQGMKSQIGNLGKLHDYLSELFDLVRFGVLSNNPSEHWINFCLPLILSSKRGNRQNSLVAVGAIYDYLLEEFKDDEDLINSLSSFSEIIMPIGKGDLEGIIGADQVGVSDALSVIQDGKDSKALEGGKLAGKPQGQISVQETENPFCRSVIENNMQTIQQTREVFKRVFEKAKWIPDYDGDINVVRQQEAYVNSFTGDVGQDYMRWSKKEMGLDAVILRDISGSTESIKTEYAMATVCLLAALEGLRNVHTGLVDFSNHHAVIKRFSEDLPESRIMPRSEGGTSIGSAIAEIKTWDYRSSNKLVFIITDGEIYDLPAMYSQINLLSSEYGMQFVRLNITPHRVQNLDLTAPLIYCGIEQIPQVVSAKILERIR